MHPPHGFDAVHARHENIEKQQIEVAGLEHRQPLAAVVGHYRAMTGALEQKPDSRLDRSVVVHDQDFSHASFFRTESNQCPVVKPLPLPRKHFLKIPAGRSSEPVTQAASGMLPMRRCRWSPCRRPL